MNENWNDYAPHILHYSDTLPADSIGNYSDVIRRHYFGNDKLSVDNFDKLVAMASDRLFKYDIEVAARLHAENSDTAKVYFVNYGYANGTRSISNFLAKDFTVAFGAGHGDDHLIFLDNAMHTNLSVNELAMGRKFIELYDSFGHDSTSPRFGDVQMESIVPGVEDMKYLDITSLEDVQTKTSRDLAQYSFWKTIPFDENNG